MTAVVGRPGGGLSLDRIVSTTLELVDEEGIGPPAGGAGPAGEGQEIWAELHR